MKMSNILALDLGTSAVKCLLMNEDGEVVNVSSVSYPSYNPEPGWVQQDPDDWIKASAQAINSCLNGENINKIDVISLSGHMSGLVMVDENIHPLYPCITLSDARSSSQSKKISAQLDKEIYAISGNPVINAFLLPKLVWIKENKPDLYNQCKYILFPKDYLRYYLTGNINTDITDSGNSLFFDITTHNWNKSILNKLGIDENILPELLKPYEIAGKTNEKAASIFNLPAGIPVAAGGADMACGALGFGINAPGDIAVNIGTSATILTAVPDINDIGYNKITFHPHIIQDTIYALGSHFSGGLSINWLTGLFSTESSQPDYKLIQSLSKKARDIAPGSEGTIYLPFLVGSGSPHFNAEAKGSFIGLTPSTSRETLFKSILEGISFNLKETLNLYKKMGISINKIRVGGGGMKIELFQSILADIFNHPIEVISINDASAIGAAITGGYAVGLFKDLKSPAAKILNQQKTVYPDYDNASFYRDFYEVYQESYNSLGNVFSKLNKAQY